MYLSLIAEGKKKKTSLKKFSNTFFFNYKNFVFFFFDVLNKHIIEVCHTFSEELVSTIFLK